MPAADGVRDALARAHDAREAADILARQDVMVSHLVFVGDAKGSYLVVERAPGVAAHVREANAVTNHFEGPLAHDPADERVRTTTTTLARRARIDELLAAEKNGSVERAVAMLRDHDCAGGEKCPPGDRRAIDAFIATHGVVFDLTTKRMWVSEGPHQSGAFARVDLAFDPPAGAVEEIAPDPALTDGRYAEGRVRAGGPMMKERP